LEYIHINSIEDIQPEKISIRQLNNKYIDRYGNRYATKFNLKTKKVEIVRLAASKEEALRLREEIKKSRSSYDRTSFSGKEPVLPSSISSDLYRSEDSFENSSTFFTGSFPGAEGSNSSHAAEEFDPYTLDVDKASHTPFQKRNLSGVIFYEKPFIDRCIQEIQKTRERQNAVINHIKKSKIFDREDKERFDDLEREIDIECWQRGEKAINYQRELYSYPRPLNYYLARIPTEKKAVLESRKEEAEKLDLVRRWELQETFYIVFKKFHTVTDKMHLLLKEKINHESFVTLTAGIQQLLKDAGTSCEIILQASEEIQQQIQVWKNKFP